MKFDQDKLNKISNTNMACSNSICREEYNITLNKWQLLNDTLMTFPF